MSLKLLENEIVRFLSSKEPEVLCIRGKWGVGKTFTWNAFLKKAKAKIALDHYAYVSLFGVNSLDELKYSIFANTIQKNRIGTSASLETLEEVIETYSGRKGILAAFQQLPIIKSHLGNLTPTLLLTIKNQIICIDDLERKGKNLDAKDVLGLISFLKEQRRCKIVLLLNNDELPDGDKENFQKYLEKVADEVFKFSLSAEEATRLVLSSSKYPDIARHCITLKITNIRIIKKIETFVQRIEPMLQDFDKEVFTRAIHSLTLFVWSFFKGDSAPDFGFIRDRRPDNYTEYLRERLKLSKKRGEEPTPDKRIDAWNALLEAYAFGSIDELDVALIAGLENGFFNVKEIKEAAAQINKRILAERSNDSLSQAWRKYHDSFADNAAEVIDGLFNQSMTNIELISPPNLDGTVRCLKDLGKPELAKELIAHYIQGRKEEKKFFDLADQHFGSDVRDPDVKKAFEDKLNSFPLQPNSGDILLKLASKSGWSADDVLAASRLPVDEYYRILKQSEGEQLRAIISFCLQFDNASHTSPQYTEISNRAREALSRIGGENSLNARRVKKYISDSSGDSLSDTSSESDMLPELDASLESDTSPDSSI